jgi:HSP20 family molecular chaperone IbpA
MTESKELLAREKQELATPAEQTQPGPVFTPAVDIFETETALTLLADMPGVANDDMVIDLRDDVLTITGAVKPFEGKDEKDVLVEFEVGRFHRQFSLSEAIDQSRIDAKLADGVLRLNLPKAEKAVPRKITVTSS